MTDYYLHADKTASTTLPGSDDAASTSFKYDPANPAPTMGGNNLPDRYSTFRSLYPYTYVCIHYLRYPNLASEVLFLVARWTKRKWMPEVMFLHSRPL